MTRRQTEDKLIDLYHELDSVLRMTDDEICAAYNADEASEIIADIRRDIERYEERLREMDEYDNRTLNYHRTADMPYLCW